MNAGERLYSAAYIIPSPNLGQDRKHTNHLRLLFSLLIEGNLIAIAETDSLQELYELLRSVPSFGPFLALQYAIDLNCTAHFVFSEMDFVVAGPGALRGIKQSFVPHHDPLTLGYSPKWSLPWSAQQPTRTEIPGDLSLGEVTCTFPAVAEPTLMATAPM